MTFFSTFGMIPDSVDQMLAGMSMFIHYIFPRRADSHILSPAVNGDGGIIRGAKALSTSAELTPVR